MNLAYQGFLWDSIVMVFVNLKLSCHIIYFAFSGPKTLKISSCNFLLLGTLLRISQSHSLSPCNHFVDWIHQSRKKSVSHLCPIYQEIKYSQKSLQSTIIRSYWPKLPLTKRKRWGNEISINLYHLQISKGSEGSFSKREGEKQMDTG